MPILRNGASLAWSLRRRISTVMFTSRWAWPARWPIRPILLFWGAKFTKICDSLLGRCWNTEQNLTPLALSAQKSITVQTNKQTHKHTNSKRYIHTLPIPACVDNETRHADTAINNALTMSCISTHSSQSRDRFPVPGTRLASACWSRAQYVIAGRARCQPSMTPVSSNICDSGCGASQTCANCKRVILTRTQLHRYPTYSSDCRCL